MLRIAVTANTPSLEAAAKILANRLAVPFIASMEDAQADYFLLLTTNYLGLQQNGSAMQPLYVDFLSGKMHYRRQQASLRRETLARALGLKNNTSPLIIDATAGLGRDSFILASLGFDVVMIERSPIIHALLDNGLQRALDHPDTASIARHLQLVHSDAVIWLKNLTTPPDIVYLDPMFPDRAKTALAKKDMRIFQDFLQEKDNDHDLLAAALACTLKRVVVKRPRLAGYLSDLTPSFSMKGSSSRFDVYLK